MNLKELSRLDINDLRNIDLNQVRSTLQERPDMLLNLVLIGITIVASFYFISNTSKETRTLTAKIAEYQAKNKTLKNKNMLNQKVTGFLNKLPPSIETDSLINKISELAFTRNVQVLEFSPTKEQNVEYVRLAEVSINVSSDDYKNIVRFIQDIEELDHSIRIKKWTGQLMSSGNVRGMSASDETVEQKPLIRAEISIESIIIKN